MQLCRSPPSSLTDLRPLVPHPRRLSPWDSAYRTLTQYHQAPERLKPFTDNVKFPRITQITLDEACKELDVFCTSMAVGEEVLSCRERPRLRQDGEAADPAARGDPGDDGRAGADDHAEV